MPMTVRDICLDADLFSAAFPSWPHAEPDPDPGDHAGCGFPGPENDGGMCPEIPVAFFSETCTCGRMELLPACQGHADEVTGWGGSFVGDARNPGVLTCRACGGVLHIVITWDDMRPATVIQSASRTATIKER